MPEKIGTLPATLHSLERLQLCSLLASLLHELTIEGRSSYPEADGNYDFRPVNEAMHRLSGHLRDLLDPAEALTDSRVEAILGNAREVLTDSRLAAIFNRVRNGWEAELTGLTGAPLSAEMINSLRFPNIIQVRE